MRALRWVWSGVLAFDRIGTRIPQLIQIWLVELFVVMPLAFFVGKVIDIHGAGGIPGTGESLAGEFWGSLAVGLFCGFFFVRSLLRPRLVDGEWAPVTHVPVGGGELLIPNRRWAVSYKYLTSHPSYALLLLLTLPIPATMVWATENQGGSTFYVRVAGWAGLAIIAAMALMRVIAWYVLRTGRDELEQDLADSGQTMRRVAWEVAWKPLVMLIAMVYGILGATLGTMAWQEHRTIAALPVASTATAADAVGTYVRVEGAVRGRSVFWAPRGTGRGGNNYSGAARLISLEDGGEVMLLAESLSVPDFIGVMDDVDHRHIRTQGKVIDHISDTQKTYYGFDLRDLPAPDPDGRILVLHSYP